MPGMQEVSKGSGIRTEVIADVFEEILSRVAKGESVRIKGFGTFERRKYKGRTLVTPVVAGGEPVEYPDSFVLKFRQSQIAKKRINVVAKKAEKAEAAAAKEAKKAKKGTPAAEETEEPKAKPKKGAPAEKPKAHKEKPPKRKPAPEPEETEDDDEEDDEE